MNIIYIKVNYPLKRMLLSDFTWWDSFNTTPTGPDGARLSNITNYQSVPLLMQVLTGNFLILLLSLG